MQHCKRKQLFHPVIVLQKKVVRMITLSHYNDHTSNLFRDLNVMRLIY